MNGEKCMQCIIGRHIVIMANDNFLELFPIISVLWKLFFLAPLISLTSIADDDDDDDDDENVHPSHE